MNYLVPNERLFKIYISVTHLKFDEKQPVLKKRKAKIIRQAYPKRQELIETHKLSLDLNR